MWIKVPCILFAFLLIGCNRNEIRMDAPVNTSEPYAHACTCPQDSLTDLTLYVCPSWLDETIRQFKKYKDDCSSTRVCSPVHTALLLKNVDTRLERFFQKYMIDLPSEILFINDNAQISENRKRRLRRFFNQPVLKHTRYLVFTLIREDLRPLEGHSAESWALSHIKDATETSSKIIWSFPFRIGKKQYKELLDDLLIHMRPNRPSESDSDIAVLVVRTDCNIGQSAKEDESTNN